MAGGRRLSDSIRVVLGVVLCIALAAVGLRATTSSTPSAARDPIPLPSGGERVVLAGGCFWGMEAVFESLAGVSRVVSGYAGGSRETARYETVSSGRTGHAESVEITYDPSKISFTQLLEIFFSVAHDPTQRDRQGPDIGTQYRSAIFYTRTAQKQLAETYIRRLDERKAFPAPIVTEVVPLRAFYPAEAYHQHFVARNPYDPYVLFNDKPKLSRLRERFPQLVRRDS
jgi:peptide-methionine (S)-S-oxide reductase